MESFRSDDNALANGSPWSEILVFDLYARDLWAVFKYTWPWWTPETLWLVKLVPAGTPAIHGVNFIEQSASLTNDASKALPDTNILNDFEVQGRRCWNSILWYNEFFFLYFLSFFNDMVNENGIC